MKKCSGLGKGFAFNYVSPILLKESPQPPPRPANPKVIFKLFSTKRGTIMVLWCNWPYGQGKSPPQLTKILEEKMDLGPLNIACRQSLRSAPTHPKYHQFQGNAPGRSQSPLAGWLQPLVPTVPTPPSPSGWPPSEQESCLILLRTFSSTESKAWMNGNL